MAFSAAKVMMTNVLGIALFKNLIDWDLEQDKYLDLHNDFACVRIALANQSLRFVFQDLATRCHKFEIEFTNVEVVRIEMPLDNPLSDLTLDNLHRGRFEMSGDLLEIDRQGRGYFYVEFYEGLAFEFWSQSVSTTDSISNK